MEDDAIETVVNKGQQIHAQFREAIHIHALYSWKEDDGLQNDAARTGKQWSEGKDFCFADRDTGRIASILGYPAQKIAQAG